MTEQELEWRSFVETFSRENQELVYGLVSETKAAILADSNRADAQLELFFLYLRNNITYSTLQIGKALQAAKIRGNDYVNRVFKIVSMAPLDYVHRHRVLLAQRLLRYTDIPKYKIAFVVGFTNQNLLYRAYTKHMGRRPKDEHRADSDDTQRLLQRFRSESSDPRISANTAEITGPGHAGLADFWERVRPMEYEGIRSYLFDHIHDIGIGHFHLLKEKVGYEGRKSGARAEELAHAALDALRIACVHHGRILFAEMAIGYATLSNACRLQLKFEKAFRWHREAVRFLPRNRSENPGLYAQVDFFKVALLWWSEDAHGALLLLQEILPDIRRHGSKELLVRTLQLGAEINDCAGNPDRAIELFSEAVDLTQYIFDDYVSFSASYNLTFLYTRLSKGEQAMAQFSKTKILFRSDLGVLSFHMSYLEGCVCRLAGKPQKAELALLEAKDGYTSRGFHIHAGLTCLELALVYLDLNDPDGAFLMAKATVPLISKGSSGRNVVAALSLLQEAALHKSIGRAGITKALYELDCVRKDPTAMRQTQPRSLFD